MEGSELGGLQARLALGGLHGKRRVKASLRRWSDGRTQGKKPQGVEINTAGVFQRIQNPGKGIQGLL